jgi:DNA repair protein RadC
MMAGAGIAAQSEEAPVYAIDMEAHAEDQIIARGLTILAGRLRTDREVFASPTTVRHYCQLRLGGLNHEVFAVLFLDVQNRMIEYRQMFRGTLTQTSVYPREVVKECLELNAAAVVLVHNHPSGAVQPSRADEALTQTLKAALALVDVRVLDHVIVSAVETLSMAERGLV